MKALNYFRKPYWATFLAGIILFISCKQEALVDAPEKSFNYEIFKAHEGKAFIDIPQHIMNMSESYEKYQLIIDSINQILGTNISLTELDRQYIQKVISKNNGDPSLLMDELLNDTDKNLISIFKKDLQEAGFNSALIKFEHNVLALELDKVEFKRYNEFANVIRLLESQESDFFNNVLSSKDPCGDAILSYTFATLALSSCGFVPILCYLAIANKVRTFKNMIEACGGVNEQDVM